MQAKNDKQKVSSSKVVFAVAIHHSRLAGAFCGTSWVIIGVDILQAENKGNGKHKRWTYAITTVQAPRR